MELSLHTEVARMSGNPLFEWIANTHQHSSTSFNEYVNDYFLEQGQPLEKVVEDWRSLVKALENREATLAVALMQSHVFRFRKIVQGLKEDS
jgi:DNA-binding FadR family transcriptional regulator